MILAEKKARIQEEDEGEFKVIMLLEGACVVTELMFQILFTPTLDQTLTKEMLDGPTQ